MSASAVDTCTVIGRALRAPRDTVRDTKAATLAGCDDSLSTLATDVAALLEELGRLRAAAGQLVHRHAEQEAVVARQQLELGRLEEERLFAQERADELHEAETRLRNSEVVAASLADELHTLRRTLADRDRHAAEVENELSRMRKALFEREALLRRDRALVLSLRLDAEQGGGDASRHDLASEPPRSRNETDGTTVGHVRFIASPDGYRLMSSNERCVRPDDIVDIEGRSFLVTGVGRSPLPGDVRPCAFLQRHTAAA
jgi:hypothetical protein